MGEVHVSRHYGWLLVAAAVVLLAVPASAAAQASRTWVSNSGTDSNPCSISAPCQTFAGAISKTAAGGEIDALSSGGFGAVTITKAITISAKGVIGGVLVSGTNGIIVNTVGDHDQVTLRGLDVNGLGTGLNGVQVLHAGVVRLEDDEIYGFTQEGVDFQPSSPIANVKPSLYLDDVQIHDNDQDAVRVIAPAGKMVSAFVTGSTLEDNGCGLAVGASADSGAFSTTGCGVSSTAGSGTATLASVNTPITGNLGVGILAAGPNSEQDLAGDLVSGNGNGLSSVGGGRVVEYGANNSVFGNSNDGSPTAKIATGAVGPQGANGSNGANGANGKNGTNGKVELITCKPATKTVTKKVHGKKKRVKETYTKCTGKLVSGTVKFTVAAKDIASASIASGKKTVANGTEITSRHEGVFQLSERLKAGHYTLMIHQGRKTTRQKIVVT